MIIIPGRGVDEDGIRGCGRHCREIEMTIVVRICSLVIFACKDMGKSMGTEKGTGTRMPNEVALVWLLEII